MKVLKSNRKERREKLKGKALEKSSILRNQNTILKQLEEDVVHLEKENSSHKRLDEKNLMFLETNNIQIKLNVREIKLNKDKIKNRKTIIEIIEKNW